VATKQSPRAGTSCGIASPPSMAARNDGEGLCSFKTRSNGLGGTVPHGLMGFGVGHEGV